MRLKAIFFFVSIGLLISSCTEDGKETSDPVENKIELKFKRLETDLFETPVDKMDSLVPALQSKYGDFFTLYCERILNIGSPENEGFAINLQYFVTDPNIKEVYTQCKYQYADLDEIEASLGSAFSRYHAYFPDSVVPDVVTNISGFNYAVTATKNTLGIGLEMYLGSNSIYYDMLGLPQYKVHFMREESLPPSVMKGWLTATFPKKNNDDHLLGNMVYQGKILYCLDKLFPEMEDSLKIDYTAKQMAFVESNESNIWSHFIEQQLLYSTDNREVVKYMAEGPFTKGLPKQAPARLGEYVGWKIVRRFMENNSDVSLQQLFAMTDAQDILTQSKYKPDR